MLVHPVGKRSASNNGFTKTLEGDRIHWRSDPAQPGNPFHVTWTPDDCSWVEEGAMDIQGKLLKPGMHWYLPGRDAGMYYVANIFEMEGTILGRKVRGLIGFDPIYMFEGGEIYKTKDALVQEKLELVWYTWATRYKDGSVDFGHFTLGHDMFGFAILGNEKGEVRYTYDVTGEVDFGSNGYWQEGIKYTAFGEQWEFIPDPKGRFTGLGKLKNPQVDGRWRRVGDTREPGCLVRVGRGRPEPWLAACQPLSWSRRKGRRQLPQVLIRMGDRSRTAPLLLPTRRTQRPVNFGGRFSRNALAASPKSDEFCSADMYVISAWQASSTVSAPVLNAARSSALASWR